jgi:hypothetical protein
MSFPKSTVLDWLLEARHKDELIGQDALSWRKAAERDGIHLPPELGGVGRGSQKINAKIPGSSKLLATSDLAEMATQSGVSSYRFSSFFQNIDTAIKHVVVPAAGAGLDSLSLLGIKPLANSNFLISDIDPLTLWFCKTNLQHCFPKKQNMHTYCCDALNLPHKTFANGYAFMDPARRKSGQRLEEQLLPPLDDCIIFLKQFRFAQIKLSPGASIYTLAQQYPEWSWEVIQMSSEVKEICGTYGLNSVSIQATQLDNTGKLISSITGELDDLYLAPMLEQELQELVVIPEPALRQSGLLQNWCRSHDLQPSKFEQVYHSDNFSTRPLCKSYRLLEQTSIKIPALKKMLKNTTRKIVLRSLNVKPDPKCQQALKPYLSRSATSNGEHTLLFVKSQKQLKALLLEQIHN